MASRSPSSSPTRSSIDEYRCDGCSFKLIKALGSGSTGDVYLAQEIHHKKSSRKLAEVCALKIVNLVDKATTKQAQLRSEVSALRSLGKHPNIVGLLRYGYDPVESSSFLQLSYASGGDLLSRIEKKPFTEAEALPLFHGILSAVSLAHSKGICHRDLKLENILLAENGAAVVADWGLSAQFSPSAPLTKDCGSLHYAAPEILSASSYYGHLVDSFSLGILFFAMVTGCFPFFGNSPRERFLDIVTRKRLPFPSSMSAPLRDLIAQLLCVSPTLRMTATQALQHQYFDSIRPAKSSSSRLFDVIVPPVSVPSGADSSKKSPVALVSKLFSSKSSKTTRAEKQVSDDLIV